MDLMIITMQIIIHLIIMVEEKHSTLTMDLHVI